MFFSLRAPGSLPGFRLRAGGLLEFPDYDPAAPQPVTVPLLQRLLSINHAHSVELSGLRLVHTTITCPSDSASGLDSRSGSSVGDGGYTTCDDEFTGPKTSSTTTGAGAGEILFANNCSGLVLRNVSAAHSGGNALSVSTSPDALVERSFVTDAGGSGIEVADSARGKILNSKVIGAGRVIQNLPGISIHDSPYGVVTRCEVAEVTHCRGIRFDSSADSGRYTNVSWNHIHHCGCGGEECLSDGGGLDGMNTNSKLPVFLEHNWVHDISAHHFGGAGIYADVSSNAMHITSNVVHDVTDQVCLRAENTSHFSSRFDREKVEFVPASFGSLGKEVCWYVNAVVHRSYTGTCSPAVRIDNVVE